MIPDWNEQGVLPPVRPGAGGSSPDRAPYRAALEELVERFATSPARAEILQGLLNYRLALHQTGITAGFQWVNGSFVENVEALEGRPPNDIDVVTFCAVPDGGYAHLFDGDAIKDAFQVDAYFFPLNASLTAPRVHQIAYWYSMWSHRRNGLWKGFLEVDLNPDADIAARTALNARIQREDWQ